MYVPDLDANQMATAIANVHQTPEALIATDMVGFVRPSPRNWFIPLFHSATRKSEKFPKCALLSCFFSDFQSLRGKFLHK